MALVVLRGLASPFRREAMDFAVAESADLVKQNIATVLTTPRGTLPWRPDFGSDLHRLRHSNSAAASHIAQQFVARALERWVPYVRLLRTFVEVNGATLTVTITYKIISGPATLTEPVTQSVTVQS